VLLLDPSLPDLEPGEFHGIVRDRFPHTQIMMLNAHTGQLLVGSASPTPVSRKLADVVNQTGSLRTSPLPSTVTENTRVLPEGKVKLRSMIGTSDPMLRTYALTRMVAARDTTVLVTGESGTGKDLIAQEIHLISSRRNQPFVVVNCSAIPETLLEAELFGFTKGSFTGAVQSRIGRIHAAHGGTLFLDEIGDMPFSLQSKILRFLETRRSTTVSRRPLLPAGRFSHSPSAPPGAHGRLGRLGRLLRRQVPSRSLHLARCIPGSDPAWLAGECPGAAQCHRAGNNPRWL
jgi:transcriptional regulator with AAA-type ATPase domain